MAKSRIVRNIEELRAFEKGAAFIKADGTLFRLKGWSTDWSDDELRATKPDLAVLRVDGMSSYVPSDKVPFPLIVIFNPQETKDLVKREAEATASLIPREECGIGHDLEPWHPIGRLYIATATKEHGNDVLVPRTGFCKIPEHYGGTT